MDWKLIATSFAAVFVAELGDKTQIAAFSLAAGGASRWAVFAGASLGLVAATALAVAAGDLVGRHLPPVWLQRGAGVLFVVIGVATLWSARPGQTPDASPGDRSAPQNAPSDP